MIRTLARIAAVLAIPAPAAPALAHHGSAAVSAIGAEGPGASLDASSPLPLGRGTLLVLAKTEYVDLVQRTGWVDPQKQYASYNTLAVGYGLTPWLSAFVFQPYNVKSVDPGGTNAGLGDTNLMLAAHLKWDEGLKLVPEKESLDELADWHFGLWGACSLPVGPTDRRDDFGDYHAPDMQTGFNGPSPSAGLTVMKQLATDLTVIVEASSQAFFEQEYPGPGISYRFGGETRVNAALPWRVWASAWSRVDLVPELALLDLRRDREDDVALQASGGTILYGQLGVRATRGALAVGARVSRAVAKDLNEEAEQQGSEGLEEFRAALVVSWSARL
jgi:hypothetical protein